MNQPDLFSQDPDPTWTAYYADTLQPISTEHAEELARCKNDPEYFAKKYSHIKGDTIRFDLPDWMKSIVEVENVRSMPVGSTPLAACMSPQRVMNQIASDIEHRLNKGNQPALVARDKGIAKVAANSPTWIEQAHTLIKEYPKDKATGEELKVFLRERIGEPAHHNAYGAMVMGAVRKGLLVGTGEFPTMKLKNSHARRNQLYRIVR